MRLLPALVATLCLITTPAARAEAPAPVVVELFTSQGCIACPPAEELLSDLARQPGVIALALHVDYWDYLGWTDIYGQPRHTERQRAYARAHRQRTVFTPQMVIQGTDLMVGHDAAGIGDRIRAHQAEAAPVSLDVVREGGAIRIRVAPIAGSVPAADIHVVHYMAEHESRIDAGENAGRVHTYTNVVTDWTTLGVWSGEVEAAFTAADPVGGPVAVIVQRRPAGAILAAADVPAD